MLKINFKEKGQTLLEVLIAMGILTFAISGVIVLLLNVSNYGTSSEARSLAVNYSQETIDVINNYRDNNYCRFFKTDGFYTINKTGSSWELNDVSDANQWDRIFLSGSKEDLATKMERSIQVEDIADTGPDDDGQYDGKRVTVSIKWTTKGVPVDQIYKTIAEIYNWK